MVLQTCRIVTTDMVGTDE